MQFSVKLNHHLTIAGDSRHQKSRDLARIDFVVKAEDFVMSRVMPIAAAIMVGFARQYRTGS